MPASTANRYITSRRAMTQQALREEIQGKEHIAGVLECIDLAPRVLKDDVPGLKLKMDGHLALLKKILPDLKAVEISAGANVGPRLVVDLIGAGANNPAFIEAEYEDVSDPAPADNDLLR